jgi:hypothetical protein
VCCVKGKALLEVRLRMVEVVMMRELASGCRQPCREATKLHLWLVVVTVLLSGRGSVGPA